MSNIFYIFYEYILILYKKEKKMLNKIWPFFIVVSVIFAFFSGNIDKLNNSIFEGMESAVELSISLLGTICFWNGIMEIAIRTSLISKLSKKIQPLIKWLFPETYKNENANKQISMNIIANVLGLGNAATPIGLRVMKTLQENNSKKDTLTNSMAMFIILNTASLQIIPTTVIAVRNSLGSESPTQIVFPVWIATVSAAITGVIIAKMCIKRSK